MASNERARRLYIDGEWREVSDGSAAVGAARTAFDTTNWSTDLPFRKRCMRQRPDVLPEDVANAVVFLASDESKWTTGLTVTVDRGNYTK
jgi:NAD(P)-dependent dehydrogenase (short-subunit alcohol dehydrogenase family)